MRVLICTQKVDSSDGVLGFFCWWVQALAKEVESVHVVCLEEGEHDFPDNVTVYSLGKEQGASKLEYIVHFYQHLFTIRGLYDQVFVHMNQEYVLLGGLFWRLSGTPVYFWRNHPEGSLLTRLAVLLSTRIYSTSTDSFTARFKKNRIMPAGINTNVFRSVTGIFRKKNSVCMIGRIAPIKRVDICLEAVKLLIDSGTQVSLTIVGSARESDYEYYQSLKRYVEKNNLSSYVIFIDSVPPHQLPDIYSSHEVCINLTPSGSFDKTIVEAAACGALPVVSNTSLEQFLPAVCMTEPDPEIVARSLQRALSPEVRVQVQKELDVFVSSQSLSRLISLLVSHFDHVQE